MSRTNFGHDIFQQIYQDSGDFVVLQPPSGDIDIVLRQEGKFNVEQDPANSKNIIEDGNLPSGINIGYVYDGDFIHMRQEELRLSEGAVLSGDFIQDKFAPLLFEVAYPSKPFKQSKLFKPSMDLELQSNYMMDIMNNTHADGTPQHSVSSMENNDRANNQQVMNEIVRVSDEIKLLLASGVDGADPEIVDLTGRMLELKTRLNPNEIVANAIQIADAEEQKRYIAAQEDARARQAELIAEQEAFRAEIAKRRKEEADRIAAIIAKEKADLARKLEELRLKNLSKSNFDKYKAKLEAIFRKKVDAEIESVKSEEEEKALGSLFPAEPEDEDEEEEEEEEESEMEGKSPPGTPPRKSSGLGLGAAELVANQLDELNADPVVRSLVKPLQEEMVAVVSSKLPKDEEEVAYGNLLTKYQRLAADLRTAAEEKKKDEERNSKELKAANARLSAVQKYLSNQADYKDEYDESLKEGSAAAKAYASADKVESLIKELNMIAEKYEALADEIERKEDEIASSSNISTTFSDLEAIYGSIKDKDFNESSSGEFVSAFTSILRDLQNNDKATLLTKKDAENLLKDFDEIAVPSGPKSQRPGLQRNKIIAVLGLIKEIGGKRAFAEPSYKEALKGTTKKDLQRIKNVTLDAYQKSFRKSMGIP